MTQVCVSCHPSHGSGNTGNSGNARDWQLCWQCCTHTILAWPPRPGLAWAGDRWVLSCTQSSGSGSGELRPGPDTRHRPPGQYGHQTISDRKHILQQDDMFTLSYCPVDTNKKETDDKQLIKHYVRVIIYKPNKLQCGISPISWHINHHTHCDSTGG